MLTPIIISLVITVLSCSFALWTNHIENKEYKTKWISSYHALILFLSIIPVFNLVTFFTGIFHLLNDAIPLMREQKRYKKALEQSELDKLNQPCECQSCHVYTRQGTLIYSTQAEEKQIVHVPTVKHR